MAVSDTTPLAERYSMLRLEQRYRCMVVGQIVVSVRTWHLPPPLPINFRAKLEYVHECLDVQAGILLVSPWSNDASIGLAGQGL